MKLFNCLNLIYINLTMFENFPFFKNPFLHHKPINTSKKLTKEVFLFQRVAITKKESRRRAVGWNQEHHLKYLACLSAFKEELQTRTGREVWQVYKQMAVFVKGKNANQCRIYHKKMMSQHDSIDSLLTHQTNFIYSRSQPFQRYLKELSASINCRVGQNKSKDQKLVSQTLLKSSSKQICQGWVEGEKKEDIFPTDVGYPEQMGHQSKPMLDRQDCMGYYHAIKQLSESYFSAILSMPQEAGHSREQDWLQCHQLFLAWISKLRMLMDQ